MLLRRRGVCRAPTTRSRRGTLCPGAAASAYASRPQHQSEPPPLSGEFSGSRKRAKPADIAVQIMADSELRPGSRVWEQISHHVAHSFVEEWRRKYPKETEHDHWRRSWQHTHAPLPSREAYWLVGYVPAPPSTGDGKDLLGQLCAVTGLLVFRGPRASSVATLAAKRCQARALQRDISIPAPEAR